MNENEKPALDERKKSALLRYVAIMFAVAFVLVLFSLLSQMRNSMSTISQLNQSSNSALQKAEQLQEHNLQLELDNQELSLQMQELEENYAELEAQLNELQQQLKGTESHRETLQKDYDLLQQELDKLKKEYDIQSVDYEQTVAAYERLAELFYAIVSGETTAAAAKSEFEEIGSNLGAAAHEVFEYLCSRGE